MAARNNVCVDLLALLKALSDLHQSAHWQSNGSLSYQDHLLFGRLYEPLSDEIDGLAEKVVQKYGNAAVDPVMLAEKATDFLKGFGAGQGDRVATAIEAERTLQQYVADALTEVDAPGMQNFIQGIADTHETALYLLGQRSSGGSK